MMKSECVLLKLTSGETVIAKLMDESETVLLLTDMVTVNVETVFTQKGPAVQMVPRFFVQGHTVKGIGGLIRKELVVLRFPGEDIHEPCFEMYDAMVQHAHKEKSNIIVPKLIPG